MHCGKILQEKNKKLARLVDPLFSDQLPIKATRCDSQTGVKVYAQKYFVIFSKNKNLFLIRARIDAPKCPLSPV